MNYRYLYLFTAIFVFVFASCGTDFDAGPSGLDCYDSEHLKERGISSTSYLETVIMKVDHFRPTALDGLFGNPVLSYRVQENEAISTEEWINRSYGFSIRNFDYEWGYTYEIVVERREIEYSGIVMDATGICHILVETTSRERVNSEENFEIQLVWVFEEASDSGNQLVAINTVDGDQESGFFINNSKKIDCGDLCDEMAEKLQLENDLIGVFEHTFKNSIRLIELK